MKDIKQEIELGIHSLISLIELSGVEELNKLIKEQWQKK